MPKMFTYVFDLLIFRPDHVYNFSKQSSACLMFCLFFCGLFMNSFKKSVRSSAYVSFRFSFPFFVSYGVSCEFLSVSAKISMQRTNRYPAMGSPCLQPLRILNCSVG